MKYVSFKYSDGQPSFGKINGEHIIELQSQGRNILDLKSALASDNIDSLPEGKPLKISDVQLLPVIPNPEKILCVGLNYENHRKETGRAKAEHAAIFTRFADSLIAHGTPIICPKISTMLDYEGELAIVISKGGRNIKKEDAFDHIAGYSCFNDASIRDWQKHNIQFTPGKNFPDTGAIGPYLVTPDEVSELSSLNIVTRLNGQIVQNQSISDMIWPIDVLIEYISIFTPLAPGDIIATGTPGGVGAKRTPPLWMKAGDVVQVSIGNIGTLINPVENET